MDQETSTLDDALHRALEIVLDKFYTTNTMVGVATVEGTCSNGDTHIFQLRLVEIHEDQHPCGNCGGSGLEHKAPPRRETPRVHSTEH